MGRIITETTQSLHANLLIVGKYVHLGYLGLKRPMSRQCSQNVKFHILVYVSECCYRPCTNHGYAQTMLILPLRNRDRVLAAVDLVFAASGAFHCILAQLGVVTGPTWSEQYQTD